MDGGGDGSLKVMRKQSQAKILSSSEENDFIASLNYQEMHFNYSLKFNVGVHINVRETSL